MTVTPVHPIEMSECNCHKNQEILRESRKIRNMFTLYNVTSINFTKKTTFLYSFIYFSYSMTPVHPIEMSERHYHKNQEKAMAENLRKVQGLHAPLKMMYEKKAVSKVGHFPCISNRSNFQLVRFILVHLGSFR